jgi:hypothetical protein
LLAGDSARVIGTGILGLALVAVVAAGSGAFRSDAAIASGVSRWLDAAIVTTAIVAFAVGLGVTCYAIASARVSRQETMRDRRRRRTTAATACLALLLGLLGLLAVLRRKPLEGQPIRLPDVGRRGADDVVGVARDARPGIQWTLVLAFLVVFAVAAIATWFVYRRRRTFAREDRGAPVNPVGEAAALSLAAVESEPDPRRAVVLAYTRMEWSLSASGIPRMAWETPFEYLDRVFELLGAPSAPAATLTALYERARFGHHPVTIEMRDAAVAALVEISVDLLVVV